MRLAGLRGWRQMGPGEPGEDEAIDRVSRQAPASGTAGGVTCRRGWNDQCRARSRSIKRRVRLVDILTTDNRLPVLGQLSGNLITHDRLLIRRGSLDRRFLDWCQNLRANFIFTPPLRLHEEFNRFCRIDPIDQRLAHMLMRKAKRMTGFMANHPVILRFNRLHGESFQVHRLLAFGNVQNIGAEIRPIAALLAIDASNAYLPIRLCLGKLHIRRLRPCIHMLQNAFAKVGGRVVHKGHRKLDALQSPIFFGY